MWVPDPGIEDPARVGRAVLHVVVDPARYHFLGEAKPEICGIRQVDVGPCFLSNTLMLREDVRERTRGGLMERGERLVMEMLTHLRMQLYLTTSGLIPKCSWHHIFPVAPPPVCTLNNRCCAV